MDHLCVLPGLIGLFFGSAALVRGKGGKGGIAPAGSGIFKLFGVTALFAPIPVAVRG